MEKTKEEKIKLLEETVAYYSQDVSKRCISTEYRQCRYSGKTIGKDTDGCAVGRLLDPELRLLLDRGAPRGVGVIFKHLPKEIKAYGLPLLQRLQTLHDDEHNWEANGISQIGLSTVNRIRNSINNGEI